MLTIIHYDSKLAYPAGYVIIFVGPLKRQVDIRHNEIHFLVNTWGMIMFGGIFAPLSFDILSKVTLSR